MRRAEHMTGDLTVADADRIRSVRDVALLASILVLVYNLVCIYTS